MIERSRGNEDHRMVKTKPGNLRLIHHVVQKIIIDNIQQKSNLYPLYCVTSTGIRKQGDGKFPR
jgi:hypothetical protein